MAQVQVTKTAPVTPQKTFVIELSEDEAKALHFVTRRIGGTSKARDMFDQIGRKLMDLGIQAYGDTEKFGTETYEAGLRGGYGKRECGSLLLSKV